MNAEENRGGGEGRGEQAPSGVRALLEAPEWLNELSGRIIGCAMEVHTVLGPGLIERLYEDALEYELRRQGTLAHRQAEIVMHYKDLALRGQRLDLVADGAVIVELKSVDSVADVHLAQLVSYLRAARLPLGRLINFNVPRLKDGVCRRLNERALPHWTPLHQRPNVLT